MGVVSSTTSSVFSTSVSSDAGVGSGFNNSTDSGRWSSLDNPTDSGGRRSREMARQIGNSSGLS